MTVTYRTSGELEHPVNDLGAAMLWLQERQLEDPMAQFIYPEDCKFQVRSVTWYLTSDRTWEVRLEADGELAETQLAALSEWVSGQNSDGLGEGFEQQPFAEHTEDGGDEVGEDEDGEYYYAMSSFDWQTNPCRWELVR